MNEQFRITLRHLIAAADRNRNIRIFIGVLAFLYLFAYLIWFLNNSNLALFGDSSRYWSPNTGLEKFQSWNAHQGSLLPTLLWSFASDANTILMINGLVWLSFGTLALLSINRATRQHLGTFIILVFGLILLWTSPLVSSWTSSLLIESFAVPVFCFVIVYYASNTFLNKHLPITFLIGLPLMIYVTKPSWIILMLPFLVFSAIVLQFRKSQILIFLVFLILLFGGLSLAQNQQYSMGLSYSGWYALTRSINFGTNAAFQTITDEALSDCSPLLDLIEGDRTREFYRFGLSGDYTTALEACPAQVKYLNSGGISLVNLFKHQPTEFISHTSGVLNIVTRPAIYTESSHRWPVNRIIQRIPVSTSQLFVIGLILLVALNETRLRIALVATLLSLYLVGILLSFHDGIEGSRHILPLSLSIICSFPLLLTESIFRRIKRIGPPSCS